MPVRLDITDGSVFAMATPDKSEIRPYPIFPYQGLPRLIGICNG